MSENETTPKDSTIIIRVNLDGSYEIVSSGDIIDTQGSVVKMKETCAERWRRKTVLALLYLKLNEEMNVTLKEIKSQRSDRWMARLDYHIQKKMSENS